MLSYSDVILCKQMQRCIERKANVLLQFTYFRCHHILNIQTVVVYSDTRHYKPGEIHTPSTSFFLYTMG